MNSKNTLNILNGQAMHDYFKKYELDKNGVYIPFNEAMCEGKVTENIFSGEFNKCRSEAHHVSMELYNDITLKPLQALFKNQFSHIVLWFDDDMFCQINLLTLLAYLDQINYKGKTTFNLINRNFEIMECFELDIKGYYEKYKKIMLNRCIPENISLPVMENGIRLYFQFLKEENEITAFIKQNENLQKDILLAELLLTFTQYGLGDAQYIQLIDRHMQKRS